MLTAITSLTPSQIDDFFGAPSGTAVTVGIGLAVGALLKAGQIVVRNVPYLISEPYHDSVMTFANGMMFTSGVAIFADYFCDKKIECLPYKVTNVFMAAVGIMLHRGLNMRNRELV